jgi:predicted metalloprotease
MELESQMELNENAQIDTSQVEDRRGAGGTRLGGGGLVGLIIGVLVTLVGGGFGINAITGGDESGDNTAIEQRCNADDALQQLDCRNTLYINSIQSWWQRALPAEFGKPYVQSDTVFFNQAVSTGCGAADSGVGPFYCPVDDKVYIDLTFYRQLAEQLGASGEFAQPYVLAHEYGHHVQDLLGTEAQMRQQQERDPGKANQLSGNLRPGHPEGAGHRGGDRRRRHSATVRRSDRRVGIYPRQLGRTAGVVPPGLRQRQPHRL